MYRCRRCLIEAAHKRCVCLRVCVRVCNLSVLKALEHNKADSIERFPYSCDTKRVINEPRWRARNTLANCQLIEPKESDKNIEYIVCLKPGHHRSETSYRKIFYFATDVKEFLVFLRVFKYFAECF